MAESGDYDAFDDALSSEHLSSSHTIYSSQNDGDIVDLYDDVMKDNMSFGAYDTPSVRRDDDVKNAGVDKPDSTLSATSPAEGRVPASHGGMVKSGSVSTLEDESADDSNDQVNRMEQESNNAGSLSNTCVATDSQNVGFQQQQQFQRRYAFLVSNLAWWTTEDEVEDAVVSLGISDVADIRINDNRQNGQSKGFAVVVVLSESSNRAVVRLAEKELNGQKPVVQVYSKHGLMELDTTGERSFGGGMMMNMGPNRFNNNRFSGPGMMMPDRPPMMMMNGVGGMMMGQGPSRGPMIMGPGGPRGPPLSGMMMGGGGGGMMMRGSQMIGGMNRLPAGAMMMQPNQMMGMGSRNVLGGGPVGQRLMMGNSLNNGSGSQNNMMMRPGMRPVGILTGMDGMCGGMVGVNMQMMQQPGGGMMLNAAGPNVHVNPAFLQQQQQMTAVGVGSGMGSHNLVNGMPMDPSHLRLDNAGNAISAVVGGSSGDPQNTVGDFAANAGGAQVNPYTSADIGMMMNTTAGVQRQSHVQQMPHQAQQHLIHQQQQHNTTTSQEPSTASEHGDNSAMSRDEILLRNKSVSSTAISRAWADARSGDYRSAVDTLTTAISIIRRSRVADDERCKILISSLEERLTAIQKEADDKDRGSGGVSGGGGGGSAQVSSRSRSRSPRRHRSSRSPDGYQKRNSKRSKSRSRSRDRRRSRDKRSSSRDRYRSSRHRRH